MIRSHIYTFFLLLLGFHVNAQEDIVNLVKKYLPGATIDTIATTEHFVQEYVVMLPQPLDHTGINRDSFTQRIFLSHYKKDAPVIFVTEGYSAKPKHYELSEILMANQIQVEYRFFGESKPDNYNYQYLTNDQAMEDLHRIRTLFANIYKKEWVSTGISKGGTTCLIYKSKYPDDVDVTVPYVAPLPYSQSDPRCDESILTNGTKDCRDRLERFQKRALAARDMMIAKVDSVAIIDSMTFNRVGGSAAAFEYAVLEFTFSFWQWGHDCDRIKDNLDDNETFEILKEMVGFDFYSDKTCDYFEPSYYQFMKENGYYSFIHQPFDKSSFKALKRFDNIPFAPQYMNLEMDHQYLRNVRVFLHNYGDNIIYIQGEYDPWGACGIVPRPERDAILMTKKKGSHFTRIRTFEKDQQKIIYDKLDKWLKAKVHPLKKKVAKA